jgi:hypothetical protein
MAERDDELALLGVLEASLGGRQRALAGLHMDERSVRQTLNEMLALERTIDARDEERRATERKGRHRKPARIDAGLAVAALLFLLALLLVLWQV